MYEYAVKSEGILKVYGQQVVLDNININIKPGEIYGLVGNNGAGKTTLLRILAGLTLQSEGVFSILGAVDTKDIILKRKRIGSLIESPAFFADMTAKQNLEYFRIQKGIPGKKCVEEALEVVGLTYARDKKFKKFSLGMKQRLGIALAIMGNPEILFLDEPINGLDPSGIIEIRNLLLKLNKEKNITIIISSHILSELSNIASNYGFLRKGVMMEQISAEELSEKCESYLEVIVSDTAKTAVLLEKELGIKNYKILPGNIINIYDDIENSVSVSKTIVNNNIELKSLYLKSINLEKYYMSLIGEE